MMHLFHRSHPPGIRLQLTLWYTAIFSLFMLVFGLLLYLLLQASLTANVDTALRLRTQAIASGITGANGVVTRIQDVTGQLPESTTASSADQDTDIGSGASNTIEPSAGQADADLGILIRILNTNGHIVYSSPSFSTLHMPSNNLTQTMQQKLWLRSVTTNSGQTIRLYSVVLAKNNVIFGVLQVGQPLSSLASTLHSVILVLLFFIFLLLLGGAVGSYWLSGYALRPITNLAHTAQRIHASDLHQRVPVPKARDEVQHLALTLNEMIERLEDAFRQQRRFIADASHELRTPVTVIRSIAEIALEEPISLDECATALTDVNAEGERLGKLINHLLELARAEDEEAHLSQVQDVVCLDALTIDVAETSQPLALERGITLQTATLEPAMVLGDMTQLIQVMMELINNALTYTNTGGQVTLSVRTDDARVRFEVSDTGIGIAARDVPHVFERFYRVDPARSRATGSNGLGLAIAEKIIQRHGGTIAVTSRVKQGSTFTVTLPLASLSNALL
jgi:two-component system OmpR family sensor kinase